MPLFLIVFFAIYGGFHLYLFSKVTAAYILSPASKAALLTFMGLMVLAPILIRLSERAGLEALARELSWVGYLWLGFVFIFVCVAAVFDGLRLAQWGLGHVWPRLSMLGFLSSRPVFHATLLIALSISVYGFFEAKDIRLEKVVVRSAKLPKNDPGLRIVQISDVHLGLIVRHARLAKVVEEIKEARPDILVSTGDLVDGQINGLRGLAELLAGIHPPLGKFAVTGNHEYYAGIAQALDFTRRAGFTLLQGSAVTVGSRLNVAGVNDPTAARLGGPPGPTDEALLSGLDRSRFTLFLKHRPLIRPKALGLFDLQLSGHTHKGQIFPFSLVTWLYYPVDSGILNPVDDCYLYVSRGTGTWGPPIRFMSRPQVTLVEVLPKEDSGT